LSTLGWIIVGGFLMAAIAMIGGVTTILKPETLERLLLPLVSVAAGTLLGGAFFHMIPEGTKSLEALAAAMWLVGGFTTFLALEHFLHWHHTHRARAERRAPVTYLVLLGDALHNFLGGLGIASTFMLDARAGVVAWLGAAAHEVPQELGDFAILVHGGWTRRRALGWNLLSALTFPLGAILAFIASHRFAVAGLVLFGAGNFIYIAASDLIPEIKGHASLGGALLHFGLFLVGLVLMLFLAFGFRH
jgi:zinc and cadmium transporter